MCFIQYYAVFDKVYNKPAFNKDWDKVVIIFFYICNKISPSRIPKMELKIYFR